MLKDENNEWINVNNEVNDNKEIYNKAKNRVPKVLLSASNISISFSQYSKGLKKIVLNVVENLDLSVHEGEIVAILGSSGSGKSLLAHAILGILPGNSVLKGEMEYNGQILDQKLKEELRGNEIALIPQSVDFLDPLMKIGDQIIGDIEDEKEKEEKRKEMIKVFKNYDLREDTAYLYPFQLSGGMARKVLFSIALINNPSLIIADEPTPGLDEKSLNETLNYLKIMANEGKGIVLITHDIHAAVSVANKIAIFYSGYLIELNETKNFNKNGDKLLHPYTKALYKSLPQNGFQLFEGSQPMNIEIENQCVYYDRCNQSIKECKYSNPELTEIGNGMKVRCHRLDNTYLNNK
ncbi:MAG: ABC transporter ATP-binding protein [Methanobrevibacter sp.]|jgi:peptide/nickel transport system ATP-binding protein|nr:ABC transporter ATP-binding protein [Candidatus Methanovirga australis]